MLWVDISDPLALALEAFKTQEKLNRSSLSLVRWYRLKNIPFELAAGRKELLRSLRTDGFGLTESVRGTTKS